MKQNSKCKYHVFMVGYSNVAITHAVRRQRKWGNQRWPTSWDIINSGLSDRHLGFPISAYVGQCPQWYHRNAWPKEHGITIRNFVTIWPISWDISTYGLSDHHLGFPISAHVKHFSQWHRRDDRPKEHGITFWNFVAIWPTSWAISTSGLSDRYHHNVAPYECPTQRTWY